MWFAWREPVWATTNRDKQVQSPPVCISGFCGMATESRTTSQPSRPRILASWEPLWRLSLLDAELCSTCLPVVPPGGQTPISDLSQSPAFVWTPSQLWSDTWEVTAKRASKWKVMASKLGAQVPMEIKGWTDAFQGYLASESFSNSLLHPTLISVLSHCSFMPFSFWSSIGYFTT